MPEFDTTIRKSATRTNRDLAIQMDSTLHEMIELTRNKRSLRQFDYDHLALLILKICKSRYYISLANEIHVNQISDNDEQPYLLKDFVTDTMLRFFPKYDFNNLINDFHFINEPTDSYKIRLSNKPKFKYLGCDKFNLCELNTGLFFLEIPDFSQRSIVIRLTLAELKLLISQHDSHRRQIPLLDIFKSLQNISFNELFIRLLHVFHPEFDSNRFNALSLDSANLCVIQLANPDLLPDTPGLRKLHSLFLLASSTRTYFDTFPRQRYCTPVLYQCKSSMKWTAFAIYKSLYFATFQCKINVTNIFTAIKEAINNRTLIPEPAKQLPQLPAEVIDIILEWYLHMTCTPMSQTPKRIKLSKLTKQRLLTGISIPHLTHNKNHRIWKYEQLSVLSTNYSSYETHDVFGTSGLPATILWAEDIINLFHPDSDNEDEQNEFDRILLNITATSEDLPKSKDSKTILEGSTELNVYFRHALDQ